MVVDAIVVVAAVEVVEVEEVVVVLAWHRAPATCKSQSSSQKAICAPSHLGR